MYKVSSSFDFQDITSLIKNDGKLVLGKLAYNGNVPSEVLFKSLTKHLKELMHKDTLRLALIDASGCVMGVVLVGKAKWDSEHFGIGIGKLKLALFDRKIDIKSRCYLFQKAKDVAASQGLDVIFARVALNDLPSVHCLEKEGGMLTDILVTFYIEPERKLIQARPPSGTEVVEACKGDKQALMIMADAIFKIDHFHADPYLPRDKCDKLYAEWVSSCLDGLVDTVLVARKDSKPVGFITCRIERITEGYSYGVIDLVGVEKEREGKGIGSSLVSEALRWFSNYTRSVYVGTQAANIPAVRLYEKMGFRQVFSEATVHLWVSSKWNR